MKDPEGILKDEGIMQCACAVMVYKLLGFVTGDSRFEDYKWGSSPKFKVKKVKREDLPEYQRPYSETTNDGFRVAEHPRFAYWEKEER